MLSLSDSFASTVIRYLVIAKVSRSNEKTKTMHDLSTKVGIAIYIAFIDSILVFGISFFSALITLGYSDLLLSIKLALFSSITMAGLSFFSEIKKIMSKK